LPADICSVALNVESLRPAPASLRAVLAFTRSSILKPAHVLPACALVAVVMAYVLQVDGRSSALAWDEAFRMRAAHDFATLLGEGDAAGVWSWFNAQVIYLPVLPAVEGVLLAFGVPLVAAAVWPSVAAYAIAGLLVARLTSELGGGRTASLVAAATYWLCPLGVRLASWGSFEHIGACLFVALALLLMRLERERAVGSAVTAGGLAALGSLLKWDYATIMLSILTLSVVLPVVWQRDRGLAKLNAIALLVWLATMAAWFAVNWDDKRQGLSAMVGQGANYAWPDHNPFFYTQNVFTVEAGMSPIVTLLLVAGLVYGAYLCVTRRWPAAAVVVPGVALAIYSASEVKHLRYVLPVMAFGMAYGSLLLTSTLERLGKTGGPRAATIAIGVFGAVLLLQTIGDNGVAQRAYYVSEQPNVYAVLDYIDGHLAGETKQPVILSPTNQINMYDIELRAAHRHDSDIRLSRPARAWANDGEAELIRRAEATDGGLIIGLDFTPASSLYSEEDAMLAVAYPDYVSIAKRLEASGVLARVDTFSLERGAAHVHLWRLASTAGPKLDP
jgi:hypothetical protein